MQVHVLRLRQAGVITIVLKTRDGKEHQAAKVLGLLDKRHGLQLSLRSVTSYAGAQPLFELYAPTLVSWDESSIHVRGFEQVAAGAESAGVLQEWVIWPA